MSGEAAPVQPWEIAELALPALFKRGGAVRRDACPQAVRVAVLGDCATQHYVRALAAALKLRGFWPEIYEAEFDQVRQEVLEPKSAFYAHRPQVIVLFNCVQTLEERFQADRDGEGFAERVAGEMVALWDRAREHSGAIVLQHNFCVPFDRPFGNFTLAAPSSLAFQVNALNAALLQAAQARPGVRLVDTESQAAYFGKRAWLDERLWCQAKQALGLAFLPPLVKAVSDALLLGLGAGVKCVVLDLDDTLWGGILGDVGLDGLELGDVGVGLAYRRFQESLRALKERGILLAVCSKNDEESVRQVFRDHPDMILRESDIAAFEVHYENKVQSLVRLKERLGLGFDAFVFLDDSRFERDLVRTALPEVQVPPMPEDPADARSALARWNLFEGGALTEEDRRRVGLYRAEATRQELRTGFTDLAAYLQDLQMEAEIGPFDSFSLPRVLQLVQRSNQFNVMTERHGEMALRAFSEDRRGVTFTVRLIDRLGDNGIVVAVIGLVQGEDLVVDTWIMSCRVLGRHVEELTLAALVERARACGCGRVVGRYRRTAKNAMVSDLYPRLGFAVLDHEGDVERFSLDIAAFVPPEIPILVRPPAVKE